MTGLHADSEDSAPVASRRGRKLSRWVRRSALLALCALVLFTGRAEDVREARAAHPVRDHFRGERHVVEDAGQLPGGLRMQALLLDDESFDRYDGCGFVLEHASYPTGDVE